jgi:ubiquinone/menaquinone biosynthesis C-methylase UbiE
MSQQKKREGHDMTTPADPDSPANSYFIDTESAAEMARLLGQERLLTKAMGGLFPSDLDITQVHDVLDIACGPGGWCQELAFEHQEIQVVGVDISTTMLRYAQAQAQVQGLDNIIFSQMDVTQPLDFPDDSFDFVNARALVGFMQKERWPDLVREMLRVTRPGGTIRLTDFDDGGLTNSAALEQLNKYMTQALYRAGHSFSPIPDGQGLWITPMLGHFVQQAGCLQVGQQAYVLDFSAGTEANLSNYENYKVAYKLAQPFLTKMQIANQQELDTLYDRMLADMMSSTFRALLYALSVWGRKPSEV